MLFKKTVHEDWQGRETNVVQSQVYTVIQSLKGKEKKNCGFLNVDMFKETSF